MPSLDAPELSFRTVVVGVDGRAGGRDAAALAAALLEPGGHLILTAITRPRGGARLGALFADVDRRSAQRMLDLELERLGAPASTVVAVGRSVADGLRSVVARHHADLLVVGSGHRGPVGRVLLGDDARRAVDGARYAVAVAPPESAGPRVWRTIAVGDDGSAESELALAAARGIAARTGARIRDCSVVGPSALGYRELSRMDSSAALAQRTFGERGRLAAHAGVEMEVLEGDCGEALAELSREVDLLIIGSRGQGPWGRLVTGSTGEYLARHAACPLLILPRAVSRSVARASGEPSPDLREPAVAAPEPPSRAR